MIDFWNRVLTNIKVAETDICPNVTSTNSDSPPAFPCVMIDQLDNPDAAMN